MESEDNTGMSSESSSGSATPSDNVTLQEVSLPSPSVIGTSTATAVANSAGKENAKAPSSTSNKGKEPSAITKAILFLHEVNLECRKITWPTARAVFQETYTVIVLVSVFTLLVLGFDWFVGKALFGPLESWAKMLGGGIGRG